MSWKPKATSSGFDKELIPEKQHIARCFGLVDCGTHPRPDYKGKPKEPCQTIQIFFEFPKILKVYKEENGEQPATKSRRFNFVFGENSNLTKALKPWIGDPEKFNLPDIVGMPAQVKITHGPGSKDPSIIYDNIDTVTEVMEELIDSVPPQITPSIVFNIDEHGFESPEFEALGTKTYEWLQKYIMESLEYKEYELELANRHAKRLKNSLPPADQTGINTDLPPFDED